MAAPASNKTPDWKQIFEDAFSGGVADLGIPLWQPQPSSPNNHVSIGDVGYLYNGEFHQILNVKKPVGNRNFLNFQSTDILRDVGGEKVPVGDPEPSPRPPPTEDTASSAISGAAAATPPVASSKKKQDPLTSRGVNFVSPIKSDSCSATYKFSTKELSGAIIIPLKPLEREHLERSKISEWKRFMASNLSDWPEPEVCTRRDLILVHSRVMTSEWAIVVFGGRTQQELVEFEVIIGDSPSADEVLVSSCAKPEHKPSFDFRRGRDILATIQQTGAGELASTPSSHCVFYRGLKPAGVRSMFIGWTIEEIPRVQSDSFSSSIKRSFSKTDPSKEV